MVFTSFNLFALLGCLVVWLSLMLVIEALLPNLYNKDIGIISFGKLFSEFYRRHCELVSKYNTGLRSLLRQGLSEPEFYSDLVYKFRKIIGKQNFLINQENYQAIKRIGYNEM